LIVLAAGEACRLPIDAKLVERLYRQAKAERWRVPADRFARALESSAARAFAARSTGNPDARELERYLASLHLEDLALACACAAGDEQAWEHFVLQQRPFLYRAADALDPGGGARDLADSLYADLFGLSNREGERKSLFRYFHGRSSLTTWLRAVLAQRHVDRLRTNRRLEALPDEDSSYALPAPARSIEPERDRYLKLIRQALAHAVANLAARDRLRLACYYAQELTLAQTGRMLGEHEATSSRQLARTRGTIKAAVEEQLKADAGLTDAEIAQCFASVTEDAGPLDLRDMLGIVSSGAIGPAEDGSAELARKKSAHDRSR
jgi:RNA polymerase sigma-70 factor (ECF subfamily)